MRALAWVLRWVTSWWPRPKGRRMAQVVAAYNVEGNTVLQNAAGQSFTTVGPFPFVDTADAGTSYITGSGRIEWYGGSAGQLPERELPIYLQMQVYPTGSDLFIRFRPMDDNPDGGSGGFGTGPWTTVNLGDHTALRDQWVTLDPIPLAGEHTWVPGDGWFPLWRTELEISPGTRVSWIAIVELADETTDTYRRTFPRDDGRGGSAGRNWPRPRSIQSSNRTSGYL